MTEVCTNIGFTNTKKQRNAKWKLKETTATEMLNPILRNSNVKSDTINIINFHS